MLTNNENIKFRGFSKNNFVDFQNFQKSNFDGGKFLKILSSINLPWDHVMSHKKFGPDRFSRFDVYWIQTNRHPDKQTDKPNLYIDIDRFNGNINIVTKMHFYISYSCVFTKIKV